MTSQEQTSVSLRLQELRKQDQVLVLAELAESRANGRRISGKQVTLLFDELGLPQPKKISNYFGSLEREELLSRTAGKGPVWRITPKGRYQAEQLFQKTEISALLAESLLREGAAFAATQHALLPPSLAPPELGPGLAEYLKTHPFDRNVFGMTRYPSEDEGLSDPVGPALIIAKEVCSEHGLEFHLASDKAISDDLWTNVAGHMWASRYGIAFFEDRADEGLNPNLNIEVGSMLMTGRRCALLKDKSIKKMPTDLVGKIYKPVDLSVSETVRHVLHEWIRTDLGLGPCGACRS